MACPPSLENREQAGILAGRAVHDLKKQPPPPQRPAEKLVSSRVLSVPRVAEGRGGGFRRVYWESIGS